MSSDRPKGTGSGPAGAGFAAEFPEFSTESEYRRYLTSVAELPAGFRVTQPARLEGSVAKRVVSSRREHLDGQARLEELLLFERVAFDVLGPADLRQQALVGRFVQRNVEVVRFAFVVTAGPEAGAGVDGVAVQRRRDGVVKVKVFAGGVFLLRGR